jgi:hypothetical protein
VEGELGGGLMDTLDEAVGMDADDILTGKGALVDAGGSDPDISVVIHDRKITAGSGRHAAFVDSLHDHDQLVRGMLILKIQGKSPPYTIIAHFDYFFNVFLTLFDFIPFKMFFCKTVERNLK